MVTSRMGLYSQLSMFLSPALLAPLPSRSVPAARSSSEVTLMAPPVCFGARETMRCSSCNAENQPTSKFCVKFALRAKRQGEVVHRDQGVGNAPVHISTKLADSPM